MFNGDLKTGDIDPDSMQQTANRFMSGVYEGFGANFESIDYNTPHYKMLANLQKNVYQFSAAKNYQQLRNLTDALKDGDRLRTFAEFKKEAMNILHDYNVRYMKPEYNTAINGALNASNWATYQEHKKAMPLLKYVTAGDNRVREEHRLLDGTVRPVDDSWWKTHYPPLSWNCRCTTYQLAIAQPITPKDKIPHVEIPKMFQVNLAEQNLIFPPGSAYYINCPKEVFKEAAKYLPPEHQYNTIHQSKSGGHVKVHANYKPKEDHELLHSIAHEKADAGHKVEILPEIHEKDIESRQRVLPGAKPSKNPDFRINGDYVEVKEPVSKKKIGFNISKASEQADRVIINLNHEVDDKALTILAHKKLAEHKNLKSIEFRHGGKYLEIHPK